MNAIDDPTIPDDLGALLRTASADLAVSPAELGSVQRRARQRRRRRHALVASGAAVVLVLAGLVAVAAATSGDGEQRVITATDPPRPEGSVAQPVLVSPQRLVSELPAGVDPDQAGGILDAVTTSGATLWWQAEDGWFPSGGFVFPDGRRFGVANNQPLRAEEPAKARIDEIGADGAVVSSRAIQLDPPSGYRASAGAIGATGSELIVARSFRSEPDYDHPNADGGSPIYERTTFSAIDVETGAERPLLHLDSSVAAAAAGDVLVYAPGTDCTLEVSTIEGGDHRTHDGGCNGEIEGMGGLASGIALSPDGRYAAVTWMTISTSGPGTETLTVVDLDGGGVLYSNGMTSGSINGMAWTGP
ncbi:MAG: hypothetical protein ACTHN0_14465, partial [Aquihabitans sp.]